MYINSSKKSEGPEMMDEQHVILFGLTIVKDSTGNLSQ